LVKTAVANEAVKTLRRDSIFGGVAAPARAWVTIGGGSDGGGGAMLARAIIIPLAAAARCRDGVRRGDG